MTEELKRLETYILLDFYEKNDNPQIEVLTDYKIVWARYLDRKTFLWEGEALEDGFHAMKLYFNCKIENESIVEIYKNDTLSHDYLFDTINKDVETYLIKRNIDLISKVQVCKFEFTHKIGVYNENNFLPNIPTDKEIRGLMIYYRLIKA